MASLTERNQTAKREDLRDALTYADMKRTKFTSMVRKGSEPQNVLVEYPVDNYPDPRITGVVDDQDAISFENFAEGRKLLYTRLQIFERNPKVSRLANHVSNVAGVGKRKEFAKSLAKALIMIKRDMETRFLGDDEAQADDGNVGNETRGLGKWIQSTAQSYLAVDADYLTPAAQIDTATALADVVDDTVIAILQALFDQTGDDEADLWGFAGSAMKRQISKLSLYAKDQGSRTIVRRFNNDGAGKKITQVVDLIESDFGRVKLMNSSFINTGGNPKSAASKRLLYIIPSNMVEVKFSKTPDMRPLENQGGGPRAIGEAYAALCYLNPLYAAKIAPTS